VPNRMHSAKCSMLRSNCSSSRLKHAKSVQHPVHNGCKRCWQCGCDCQPYASSMHAAPLHIYASFVK
jgi:hypothetical protein